MNITENYYTSIQLRLPVNYTRIIDINNPVYSFIEGLNHMYIDGTKVETNANKFTWVWKRASLETE